MKKIFSIIFIFSLILINYAKAQSQIIYGWTFDDLQAADQTLKIIPSNYGTASTIANIYADGTNGSSDFTCVTVDPEWTAFAGTTLNDPRTTPTAGNALTVANQSSNGKSFIIKFSMTGYQNAMLTFSTRGTSTGFNNHQWAWSIDNVTYTNFGDNTARVETTFEIDTVLLSNIPEINNAETVYLKLTVDGASSISGNNRFDNIMIQAETFFDLEVLQVTSPTNSTCGSLNSNVAVKIKNHSPNSVSNFQVYAQVTFPDETTQLLQYQVSSIAANSELTQSIGTINTTSPGTYGIKAFTSFDEDSNLNNDTLIYQFVIADIHAIPFTATFDNLAEDSFWTLNGFSFADINSQANSSRLISASINSGNLTSDFVINNTIDTLKFHNHLIFDYRLIQPTTFDSYTIVSGDSLNVYISSDCGNSYSRIKSINATNHINSAEFYHMAIPLNSYAGNKIMVKFESKTEIGDFISQIDNFEVRNGDLWDMGAITKVSPINTPCGNLTDTIKAIYKNTGDGYLNDIPVSVQISRPYSPPFVTYNDTIHQILGPGEEVLFTFSQTINTTVAGKYTFLIRAIVPFDTVATLGHNINNILIDSVRIIGALPVPFYEGFANNGYSNNFTTSATFDAVNENIYQNFTTGNTSGNLTTTRRIGAITASHQLFFDYAYTQTDGTAIPMGANDSIVVSASSDCGSTFNSIYTINSVNHTTSSSLTTVPVALSSLVGQNIILKFDLISNTNNSKIILDEIIIDGLPQINITGDSLVMVCEGDTHNVVVNGATYYDYEWTNTNNPTVVIGTTQNLEVTESGYYKVVATNNVGMTSSDSVHVYFQSLPTVNFNIPSNISSLCPNGSFVTLTGNSPAGGTFSGTGVSVNRFYPQTAGIGEHIITYTVTSNGCTNYASDTIIVNPFTTVSLTGLPDLCLNSDSIILNQGTPTGGTYSGIGVSGNTFNPQTAGVNTHIITYSYTDEYQCTYTSSDTLIVKPLPNAFAGNNTSICKGNHATLVASGGDSYVWNTQDENNSIIVEPTTTTTYIVTVTGINGCTKSDSVTVTVNEYPVATLNLPFDTVCLQTTAFQLSGGSGTPAGGTGTYSGTGVSGSWFNPAIGLGTFTIRYTYSLHGCDSSATQKITVINCTGVEEFDSEAIISMKPNPVQDKLTLSFTDNIKGNIVFVITDFVGRKVLEQNINASSNNSFEIETSSWKSGAYLVNIYNNNRHYTYKLIKL